MNRLPLFVIRLITPASEREWIVGDTVEEHAHILQARGTRAARQWLWREMWRIVLATPRLRLAARHHGLVHPLTPATHSPERVAHDLFFDFRYAARRWRSRPGLAGAAILTLGLGIGATTAIFSLVDGVLLRPAPWPEPERLMSVFLTNPSWRNDPVFTNWDNLRLSWPDFRDVRQSTSAFEAVAAWTPQQAVLGGDASELVATLRVSSNLLSLLGTQTIRGRPFTAAEDQSASEAVIISYEAWQRRFGADEAIVGRRLVLDDAPRTIVGVLPRRFRVALETAFINDGAPAEFLIPFGTLNAVDRSPTNLRYNVVARLARGSSLADATAQAGALLNRGEGRGSRVVPLVENQLSKSREPLVMLLAGSTLLLLIACVNVAGLILKDVSTRQHELALRRAIGADRWRVARQMFVEGLVLALGGGIAGIISAWWLTPSLVALAPAGLPRIEEVAVDMRAIAFAAIVTSLTTILFAAWPSIRSSTTMPALALRDGRQSARPRSRLQRLLVVGQVAVALVLLTAAALLAETLIRLSGQPVGFDPRQVLVMGVRVPGDASSDPAQRSQLEQSVLDRIRGIPGVESAAAIAAPPFGGVSGFNNISVDGRPGERLSAQRHVVTEDYFKTMAMPILRGRGFEIADAAWRQLEQPPAGVEVDGAGVVLVSRELERRFFGGAAIGRRLTFGLTHLTVVGVVPDVKMGSYTEEATPAFYLFARQMPWLAVSQFVVRTHGDSASVMPRLRDIITSINSRLAISTMAMMNERIGTTVADQRYRAFVSSAFGTLALVLTVVGLFGLLSRSVSERRFEIGMRMAIGARPADVLRLIIGEGGALVFAGLLLGIPAAATAARVIRSQLYGVQPSDPHVFVLASLVLAMATLAAVLLPAIRASRVDPVVALRAG